MKKIFARQHLPKPLNSTIRSTLALDKTLLRLLHLENFVNTVDLQRTTNTNKNINLATLFLGPRVFRV